MGIDGITLSNRVTGILLPSDTYRTLNGRRTDIDWRIATLAPDDPTRGILWQELELLLTKLRKTVSDLARSPATHLLELQAKAVVLATLLQPGETGGGPVISEDERTALALSLTDDMVRFSAG
jgi:hypothetical protein